MSLANQAERLCWEWLAYSERLNAREKTRRSLHRRKFPKTRRGRHREGERRVRQIMARRRWELLCHTEDEMFKRRSRAHRQTLERPSSIVEVPLEGPPRAFWRRILDTVFRRGEGW